MGTRQRFCGGRGCDRRMRQFLDPTLLLLLKECPAHGYTLLGRMAEFNLDFLDPTVIYRALRKMEEEGWVTSTWEEEDTQGPPRRIYAITPAGEEVLSCCIRQLEAMQNVIRRFRGLYATTDASTTDNP